MLHYRFYGSAKYFCKEIPFSEIASDDGADEVCKSYTKNALTIVKATSDTLLTKCGNNESFRNFEWRFAAAIAKMKSHSSNALHEFLTAFILLSNRNVDTNQRISVLSSATSHDAE